MIALLQPETSQALLVALIVAVAIAVRVRWPRRAPVAIEVAAILVASGVAGAAYHLTSERGFLARPQTIAGIRQAERAARLPRVDAAQVRRLIAERGAVPIDARSAPEFDAGHIDGAIHVPEDLPADQRRARLASVRRDRILIVYCSRNTCHTSDAVAALLLGDGYDHVRIFAGGWEAW
jgi:rhodanese-related sulfurtransferase